MASYPYLYAEIWESIQPHGSKLYYGVQITNSDRFGTEKITSNIIWT